MSVLAKVTHELKEVGLVTVYFLCCFGIILTLKKLFLAEYQIEVYAISVVVISALVAAKVVVILDHTRLGTRFAADQPPGVAAMYKTLIYGAVAFFLIGAESVFHAYRESGAFGSAISEVWADRDRNVIFAKAICVALTFAGYHLFVATDRCLGKGELWRMIWGKR
jgi:hypothetical protein